MTVLERKNRRQARQSFHKKPFPKRAIFFRKKPRRFFRHARDFFHDEMEQPPEVDEFTVQAMQIEVKNLLDESNGSCTILSMANALASSRTVMDLHSQSFEVPNTAGTSVETVTRKFWNLGLGTFRQKDRETEKRYELMRALRKLQIQPSASVLSISGWDEAEEELRKVLTLPPKHLPEATTSDNEENLDESTLNYLKRLREFRIQQQSELDLKPSQEKWKQIIYTPSAPRSYHEGFYDIADLQSNKYLKEKYKERDERLKDSAIAEFEDRLLQKQREDEAREKIASIMRPLSEKEQDMIHKEMESIGSENDIIRRVDMDSIQRVSLRRLLPGEWLNDEVIHFFLLMLAKRDERMCEQDSTRRRSHFFKSFFITSLLNVGSSKEGKYEYRNVQRWSKKVPGKDIFNLDKIIFPINQGRMHWVCAVAYMQEKRIQFYDSLGSDGMQYLEAIFKYIQDEHHDKKGSPLPDIDGWRLIPCSRDTPRQLNSYDCGVFTCMFADFLSKDCPLVFDQNHITLCRERIALSILNGQAIM